MDLINGILGLKQAQQASQIQLGVAKKILDMQRADGAAAIKLIEAAARGMQPGDELVAAATGLGGVVDTYG